MKRKKKKTAQSTQTEEKKPSTDLVVSNGLTETEEETPNPDDESEPETGDEGDEDPLKTIYEADERGEKVDMTKLERKRFSRSALIGLLLGAGIVIAAAAYAGFLLFNPDQTPVNQEEAELIIEVPDKILSGDEIELVVVARNHSRVDWNKAEVTARFPDGWVFAQSDPTAENSFNNAWNLGSIDAGSSKTVRLTGQLLGEINATKSLEATLIYTPGNFQSEFKEVVTKDLMITDSILSIQVEGPTKVVNDQETTATVSIENRSKAALEQVSVRVEFPKNIQLNSTDPIFTDEEQPNEWSFDRLEPNQKETFLLHVTMMGNEGDRMTMKGQVGLNDESGRFKIQQEASLVTEVISPELEVELELNGSVEDQLVKIGDTLQYRIRVQNASELVYNDVRLSLNLDALTSDGSVRLLDWDRVVGISSKQIDGSLVTWSSEDVGKLKQLDPEDEVEVSFSVPLVSALPESAKSASRLRIEGTAKISSFETEEFEEVDVSIESKTVTAKLASTFNVLPEARYFTEEFDQLGEGPLPPKAGETTTYAVFFSLSNTLNELSDVVVSATLPSTTVFKGETEVDDGELSFDEKNHTLTWRVSELAAHTGTANPTVSASFLVSVTPSNDDVDKPMTLVSKVVAAGRDSFTDQKLTDDGGSIDTELENDVGAAGNGRVVE